MTEIKPCPCCHGEMEYTDEVEYERRPYWECKDCCYAFEELGDGSYEVHEQLSAMAEELAALKEHTEQLERENEQLQGTLRAALSALPEKAKEE